MSSASGLDIHAALRLHQTGDLSRAEALYRQILEADPEQPSINGAAFAPVDQMAADHIVQGVGWTERRGGAWPEIRSGIRRFGRSRSRRPTGVQVGVVHRFLDRGRPQYSLLSRTDPCEKRSRPIRRVGFPPPRVDQTDRLE